MRYKDEHHIQLKLGQRIAQLRSDNNLTQEKLAAKAGLDRMTVALIETGRRWPRAVTLNKLANGVGVSIEEFFRGM